MIADFKDDEIILQLVEEKTQLETKCKELETKLRGKTADETWTIALTVLGLGIVSGFFIATFFCFQSYRRGYDSAEDKYKKEICEYKHPKSVSDFTKCIEKGEKL